jgi:methionyl-tRNA synthetase
MPKCNNCGKVVGSNDLENGVCYSCRNNIPSNTTNNKIITTDKQYKTTKQLLNLFLLLACY